MRHVKKAKKYWKRFRDFLNEDSLLSWIANVALAFVLIKFIVYPALGLVFGTQYPIVAVVSGSMEHPGSFDDWWSEPAVLDGTTVTQGEYYASTGIAKEEFGDFPFSNGFNTGDIMILRGIEPDKIDVGDIIVFRSSSQDPIIHRVIEKDINEGEVTFTTKGDNNPQSYGFETGISEDVVIGKAIFRIPWLGYVKIWFFKIIGFII
ncbi:MAG: signal peptidase I [Nanoarchaeota archaeon]